MEGLSVLLDCIRTFFSFFFQDKCPAAIAPDFELSDLYFCMNLLQNDAGQTLFAVAAGSG